MSIFGEDSKTTAGDGLVSNQFSSFKGMSINFLILVQQQSLCGSKRVHILEELMIVIPYDQSHFVYFRTADIQLYDRQLGYAANAF